MKDETLGQIFKRYREAEGIKISQVEKETKINHRMIEALENDNYRAMPDELYVKNIIKTYASYLNLDFNRLLLLYDAAKKHQAPAAPQAQPQEVKVILTPQRVRNMIIVAVVLILFGYLGWQLTQVFQAPKLVIYQPVKDLVTTQNFIDISGKTEKEAQVFINDKEVYLDYNGEFKTTLDLQKGLNLIKISAVKKRSAANTVYRQILVQ